MNKDSQEFTHDIVRCISRLERQRRRYMDEHLRDRKVYGSMFMIVLFLDRNPGSSQDDLCDFLGIDKSGVARKCRELEDFGYIRREQSQKNRRKNKLFLSENGQELLLVIRELLSQWHGILVKGMDEHDQKELLKLLERMMENVIKI